MGLLDHVKIENLDEDQRKMVELVGLDGFKSLVRAFGGTTIYIPKAESLERWVRFILFGKLDNPDDDMEGQMSIYDYPEAF